MIAKATAISHGINALRYITGESSHKKHPEKIHHIATYFFDGAFTARSMLEAIKFKCADYPRLKNNIIRIEISPASAPSGGGGGSSANNNWGRDKDEDDLLWARRCAKAATQKLGKQPKYGYRR